MPYIGRRRRPALGPVQRHYARLNYANPLIHNLFVAVPDFSGALAASPLLNVASPAHSLLSDYTVDGSFWKRHYSDYRGMPLVGGWSQDVATRYVLPDVSAFLSATNQVTLSMLVRVPISDATGDQNAWDLRDGAGSAQHYPYIDDTIYLGTFAASRWLSGTANFPTYLYGRVHMVTITFANGAQNVYINERLVGTGTAASNPAITYTDNSGYPGFGGRVPTADQDITSQIYALWMWNRILSQGEVEYHVDNPWDTFEAANRRRYYIAGAPSSALLGSSTLSFIPTGTMVSTGAAAGGVLHVITTGMRW